MIIISILSLIGCKRDKGEVVDPEINDSIPPVAPEDFVSGMFYIKSESRDAFYPVYLGSTTYDTTSSFYNPSPDRVIWFTDEDEYLIPTLYKGDSLICVEDNTMPEAFVWERFEDVGYSVGVAGIKMNNAGKMETKLNVDLINSYSEAGSTIGMLSEEEFNIVFETVGGDKLVQTDFTRAGTINGMQKDEYYDLGVHLGTVYHPFTIKADTRIMISYEMYETLFYEYNKDNYVELVIPEYFHSGYYIVNGAGVFRYVNDTKDANLDEIDFNEPYFIGVDEDGDVITADGIDHNPVESGEEDEEIEEIIREKDKVDSDNPADANEIDLNEYIGDKFSYDSPDGLVEMSINEDGTLMVQTPSGSGNIDGVDTDFLKNFIKLENDVETGKVSIDKDFLLKLENVTGDDDVVRTLAKQNLEVTVTEYRQGVGNLFTTTKYDENGAIVINYKGGKWDTVKALPDFMADAFTPTPPWDDTNGQAKYNDLEALNEEQKELYLPYLQEDIGDVIIAEFQKDEIDVANFDELLNAIKSYNK